MNERFILVIRRIVLEEIPVNSQHTCYAWLISLILITYRYVIPTYHYALATNPLF